MSAQGEKPDCEETRPQNVENVGGYSNLTGLDNDTFIELGLAAWDQDTGWRLLDKGDTPDAFATLIKGANGGTYIQAYVKDPTPYERNEPVPVNTEPFLLGGHWVQYVGLPITDSRAPVKSTYVQRPARRWGGMAGT